LNISSSGTNDNFFCQIPKAELVETAISLRELDNPSTDLEVVLDNTPNAENAYSYSVFYSQAVSVSAANATLFNQNAIEITKGDASPDDLILPGTTLIEGGRYTPINSSMSLNDTKLTLTPVDTLLSGETYTYNVDRVEVLFSELLVDVSGDNTSSFTVSADKSEVFDINDVQLDNENYTAGGIAINDANSAVEPSSSVNNNRQVYCYFPYSINSLQSLTIRQVNTFNDDVSRTDVNNFTILDNGSVNNWNFVSLIALAENESVERDNISRTIIHGSALPDTQKTFRFNGGFQFMSDNLTGSENSISFDYAYETKAGEIATSTLTLPVL
jgi:hypothetical protein